MPSSQIYTIGHSTHTLEAFLELLAASSVSAVADVRSVPASRFAPQYNRRTLSSALAKASIEYVFLGEELGARSHDRRTYVDGKVQYSRLAATDQFRSGIDRLVSGSATHRIAIVCTEREPLVCHRTILVSRVLAERGVAVAHIHGDGRVEAHADAMMRLREKHHLADASLFENEHDLLARALALQEAEIAYVDKRLLVSP